TDQNRAGRHQSAGVLSVLPVRSGELVIVDVCADLDSEQDACILIETVMDYAIYSRVRDVIRNLLKSRVMQSTSWGRRCRQGDRERARAINERHHCRRGISQRAMRGWVGGETRRYDKRLEARIGKGFVIAVSRGIVNRRFGPPEFVLILGVKGHDRCVA